MYSDVIDVRITGEAEFHVTFADGLTGRVRLLPSHLYGVFERLKEPDFFRRICVTEGFVSWPDEIDLAPDAMYAAIKRDGEWILS